MPSHVNMGNSIECSKSTISVRKISKKPILLKIEQLNGELIQLLKYKTNIRAIVKITKELSPKEPIICKSSFLDLNEELNGESIEIYTSNQIKLGYTSNFSNVHGIQEAEVKIFTYAKIITPWRFIVEQLSRIPQLA